MTEKLPDVEPLPAPPDEKICAWCGAPSTDQIIVQKENLRGSRYKAVYARACATCKRRLESRYL